MNAKFLAISWLVVLSLMLCVGRPFLPLARADATDSVPATAEDGPVDNLAKDTQKPVADVTNPTWLTASGTAFVVHPEGYLVTHASQVKTPELGGITVHRTVLQVILGSQRYAAKVVQVDPHMALALLKIDAANLPALPLGDSASVPLGEDARLFGFTQDRPGAENPLRITRGSISGFETRDTARWLLTEKPNPLGLAGAPLVNVRGEVIAVATPYDSQKTFGLCAPINELRTWLKTAGLNLPTSSATETLDGAVLAARVSPAVARVEVTAVHLTLQIDAESIEQIAISPDGSWLATCAPKQSRLWNLMTRSFVMLPPFNHAVFSPRGGFVALVSDPVIRIYDLQQRKIISTVSAEKTKDIVFLPDDSQLLLLVDDGLLVCKQADQFQSAQRLLNSPAGESWQRCMPSPDGQRLAVQFGFTDDNTTLAIWDLAKAQQLMQWPAKSGSVRRIAFTPDGSQLISTHYNDTRFWNSTSGELTRTVKTTGFYAEWQPTKQAAHESRFLTHDGNYLKVQDASEAKQLLRVLHEAGYAYGDGHFTLSADQRTVVVSGEASGTPPGPSHVSLLSVPYFMQEGALRDRAISSLKDRGFQFDSYQVKAMVFDDQVAALFQQANTFDEFSNLSFSGASLNEQDLVNIGRIKGLRELDLDGTPIRDSWLAHLSQLTKLSNLDLLNTPISDEGLQHLKSLTALEYLYLPRTRVTGPGLAHLTPLSKLKTLSLYGSPVSDAVFEHLARLKSLSSIDLETTQITGKGLEQLKQLPYLTNLDLSQTALRDDAFPILGQLVGLQSLALNGTLLTDRGLAELVRLPGLSSLQLNDTATTDAGMVYVGEMHGLRQLYVDRTWITDAGLKRLGQLPLTEISLAQTRVGDEGAIFLGGLPKLNDLTLSGTRVTDIGVAALKARTDMRYLHLRQTKITDEALKTIGAFKELRWLELGQTQITGAGLAALSDLAHVWSLNLEATGVTDEGLKSLAGWKALENLRLKETAVTDQGLRELANLPSLELLDLQQTKITDQGIALLAKLPLESLYLKGTAITDQGLQALAGSTRLESLTLMDTAVTEQGIHHLRNCQKLRWIDLTRTKVTSAIWDELLALHGLRYVQLNETQAGGPVGLTASSDRLARQLLSVYLDQTPMTDADLQTLKSFTGLQHLSLKGVPITDAGLQHLHDLANLQVLILEGTRVTDQGVASLSGIGKLATLNLNHTAVTDSAIGSLADAICLERLLLDGTRVTGEGLSRIAKGPHLRELTLAGTSCSDRDLSSLTSALNLRKLDLHDTKVTQQGLVEIAKHTSLTELDLSGSSVSATGFASLQPLQRLRVLKLNRTQLNAEGMAKLESLTSLVTFEAAETSVSEADRAAFLNSLAARVPATLSSEPLPEASELVLVGRQATWMIPPLKTVRIENCESNNQSGLRETGSPFNTFTLQGIKTFYSFTNPYYHQHDAEIPCVIRYRNAYGVEIAAMKKSLKTLQSQETIHDNAQFVYDTTGRWSIGSYFVEVEIEGQLVGRSRFEVHNEPPDLRPPLLEVFLFESDGGDVPMGQRTHLTAFDTAKTRYINTEFVYRNMAAGQRDTSVVARVEYITMGGKLIGSWDNKGTISKDWTTVNAQGGWGSKTAGTWEPDSYAALVYIDGKYVGGIPFVVTGQRLGGSTRTTDSAENDSGVIGGPYMPRASARPRSGGRTVSWDRIQLPMYAYQRDGDSYWVGRAWVSRSSLVPLDDAAAYYTSYLKSYPDSDWAYHLRGIAYHVKGKQELAESDLNRAIELNPNEARYYVTRAHVTGDEAARKSDLQKALSLDPENAAAHYQLAGRLADSLLWDLWYEQVIYLDDMIGIAQTDDLESELEMTRGEFEECMRHYDEAIRLNPGMTDAYFERALGWMLDGNLPKAIEDFTVVIDATRSGTRRSWHHSDYLTAEFYYLRAACRDENGEEEGAIRDFDTALRRFPKWYVEEIYETQYRLAWILATASDTKLQEPKRALQYAQWVHATSERVASTELALLGAASASAGDFEAAIAWQKKAIETSEWMTSRRVAYRRTLLEQLRDYEQHITGSP